MDFWKEACFSSQDLCSDFSHSTAEAIGISYCKVLVHSVSGMYFHASMLRHSAQKLVLGRPGTWGDDLGFSEHAVIMLDKAIQVRGTLARAPGFNLHRRAGKR